LIRGGTRFAPENASKNRYACRPAEFQTQFQTLKSLEAMCALT
jgi:hypothetical protein